MRLRGRARGIRHPRACPPGALIATIAGAMALAAIMVLIGRDAA
jgi:hypothetical protein